MKQQLSSSYQPTVSWVIIIFYSSMYNEEILCLRIKIMITIPRYKNKQCNVWELLYFKWLHVHKTIPEFNWRRKWQHTQVLLPREFHGQRSLVGYSPWSGKGSDTTKWLTHTQKLLWCRQGFPSPSLIASFIDSLLFMLVPGLGCFPVIQHLLLPKSYLP